MKVNSFEKNLTADYYSSNSFDELLITNHSLHSEIAPENYERSYLNPEFSSSTLGTELGRILSFYYGLNRKCIHYAINSKKFMILKYNEIFITLFDYIERDSWSQEGLMELITGFFIQNCSNEYERTLFETYNPDYNFPLYISEYCTLDDLRYLFRYGNFITENEIATARFLNTYPEDGLKTLAQLITRAFINGFKIGQKNSALKSTVGLNYNIGQERIIRFMIPELKKNGLLPYASAVNSSHLNKQYLYDHRFDNALWLDNASLETLLSSYQKAAEKNRSFLSQSSGDIVLVNFGEEPFKPSEKNETASYSEEQLQLLQTFQLESVNAISRFKPRTETSFTAIPFPSPQIGPNFEDIFRDILPVLMIDTDHHEKIQQLIIDLLDPADHVIIKGVSGNRTDIRVNLQHLADPETQTNFLNTGADLNIPVGEVFTSPELTGTEGILHIEETFLNGLFFSDLVLEFKNGYTVDYSCSNFPSDSENRKYIEENLLFPHKSLPMGEFAIGTNTLAYMISRKYKILDVLHPLIIEKMGPHFAIGDTCFMMSEEAEIINRFNGKHVTAKDNSKSCLRKTDRNQAYFFTHTDITLSYESIELISAVYPDGSQVPIIEKGRFVVKGTEELNIPLEQVATLQYPPGSVQIGTSSRTEGY